MYGVLSSVDFCTDTPRILVCFWSRTYTGYFDQGKTRLAVGSHLISRVDKYTSRSPPWPNRPTRGLIVSVSASQRTLAGSYRGRSPVVGGKSHRRDQGTWARTTPHRPPGNTHPHSPHLRHNAHHLALHLTVCQTSILRHLGRPCFRFLKPLFHAL